MPTEPTTQLSALDLVLDMFNMLHRRVDGDDFQKEKKARLAMLEAVRKYYDGEHPKFLKVNPGEKDHNVIINLCKTIVRKSVSWLFGDFEDGAMLKFTIKTADRPTSAGEDRGPASKQVSVGDASADDTTDESKADKTDPQVAAAEQWLDDCWKANGGAKFLLRMGRRSAVAGHGFVKIIPVGDTANDADKPLLVLQRTDRVFVVRREDDDDKAQAFVIEWSEKRPQRNGTKFVEVQMRQIITRFGGKWVVATFSKTGRDQNKWVPEIGPFVWPFQWCPIVDWQNISSDGYYGESDLDDLTIINDTINFTASNVGRILYFHAHPRTIGTGLEANEVQETAIDSFWTIANTEAKINNLEMKGDLKSSFDYLQFLWQSFWDVGRDVDLGSLRDKIGDVTNFGLRVLANAAISKLGEKRMNYGEALNQINRIFLELGTFPVQDTEIHWLNPLPEDEAEEVDRLKSEIEMRITSRQTATEERGRDWEQEQQRIKDEQAGDGNIGAELLKNFERGGGFNPLPNMRQRLGAGQKAGLPASPRQAGGQSAQE